MNQPQKWTLYNEIEPFAAEWLRELMKAGVITDGDVDERSIEDISPNDVLGYGRLHLFGGIGVWDYALRLAGFPSEREVWTCSCPCQPFSSAGKGAGFGDERHLWPAAFHLISECRPELCFGEQVASDDGLAWLDLVQADLEGCGYTVGATVTPAAGYGAPHGRHRIYWCAVADAKRKRDGDAGRGTVEEAASGVQGTDGERQRVRADSRKRRRVVFRFAEPDGRTIETLRVQGALCPSDELIAIVNRAHEHAKSRELADAGRDSGGTGGGHRAGLDASERCESGIDPQSDSSVGVTQGDTASERREGDGTARFQVGAEPHRTKLLAGSAGAVNGFWRDADWLHCAPEPGYPAGRWRAVEPGTFPLAHGATARVVKLRGYGNALVAQQAAAFIEAFLQVEAEGRVTEAA